MVRLIKITLILIGSMAISCCSLVNKEKTNMLEDQNPSGRYITIHEDSDSMKFSPFPEEPFSYIVGEDTLGYLMYSDFDLKNDTIRTYEQVTIAIPIPVEPEINE